MDLTSMRSWICYIRVLGDLVIVNLAIAVSFWLRFWGSIPQSNFASYIDIIPIVSFMAFLVFQFYGLYDTMRKPWSEIVASLIASIVVLTPLTVTISFMFRRFAYPRSVFFLGALVQFALLYIWRRLLFQWERKKFAPMKTMIIAPGFEALDLAKKAGIHGYEVVALASDISIDNCELDAVRGVYSKIDHLLITCKPSVIFMSGETPEAIKQQIVTKAFESGVHLYVVPSLYEVMLAKSRLDQMDDIPVLEIGVRRELGKEQIKRLMDICFATVGLVVAAPVMLFIAIAIKLDSSGPVFYRQERVSQGGKRFMVWKFRTMTDGAEKNTGPVISKGNDPRITRVGRILRIMRIDELPQLWNVLKGDMSIVGPRPERPFFVEQFEKEIPEYSARHTVKAGITGLAQVAGRYSTSPEDKLKYDLFYAKSASPLADLRIMLQTIKVIFMRDKAS